MTQKFHVIKFDLFWNFDALLEILLTQMVVFESPVINYIISVIFDFYLDASYNLKKVFLIVL